jgi:hypothetical protein
MDHADHRWGSRFESGLAAEVRSDDGLQGEGVVRNVSLSGAYVQTGVQGPIFSRMYVRPLSASAHWMPAYIVRTDELGVAMEWVHPGMAAIRSWLPLRAWQQAEAMFDPLRELQAGTR